LEVEGAAAPNLFTQKPAAVERQKATFVHRRRGRRAATMMIFAPRGNGSDPCAGVDAYIASRPGERFDNGAKPNAVRTHARAQDRPSHLF